MRTSWEQANNDAKPAAPGEDTVGACTVGLGTVAYYAGGKLGSGNSEMDLCNPGIISPLTASFALQARQRSFDTLLDLFGTAKAAQEPLCMRFAKIVIWRDGCLQWERAAWLATLVQLPFSRRGRTAYESALGCEFPASREIDQTLAAGRPQRPLARLRRVAQAAKAAWSLGWRILMLRRCVIAFRRRVDSFLALDQRTIGALSLAELAQEYRRVEHEVLERWDAPIINQLAYTLSMQLLRRLLRRWFGKAGLAQLPDALLRETNLLCAEPVQRIAAMAAVLAQDPAARAALAAGAVDGWRTSPQIAQLHGRFMSKFGDTCAAAPAFESVPLSQDAAPLLAAVLAAPGVPASSQVAAAVSVATLEDLCKSKPFRHILLKAILRYARSQLRVREALRHEAMLVTGLTRQLLLAIGAAFVQQGWLDHPRDILALDVETVLRSAENPSDRNELRVNVVSSESTLPRSLYTRREFDPLRRPPVPAVRQPSAEAGPGLLAPSYGLGLSPGIVRGRVYILPAAQDIVLAADTILVTRRLDTGAIAAIMSAGAFIVEERDLCPQAAIIARTRAIPCVGACPGATQWLHNGDLVEIDGTTGMVHKLAPAAGQA